MRIEHDVLQDFVEKIFKAAGSEPIEAAIVADHLVLANLSGHDSHGVGMIPRYIDNIKAGALHPNEHVEQIKKDGSILVFDGRAGFGQVVAREAMAQAISVAKETGLALSALRNAHHIGRVGTYGEQCADAGLVSIHFVNVTGHRGLVAPHRGADARYGTNPICVSLPDTAEEPRIILDFATSKVALGKIRVAHNSGKKLEEGLLIDKDGNATTDPGVMFSDEVGSLLPLAEHKGYGLALMCELLTGAIGGGGTIQPKNVRDTRIINNMLSIIIDPTRLTDTDYIASEMKAMCDYVRDSPPRAGYDNVIVPGDPEREQREQRRAEGIDIDEETWRQITEAAASHNVTL
ncbi:malate/lactate/ureidoglycolate dehydrogenase [Sneathiella sp. HT1-7]|uniref:malate/lactate/ureidoglycolate dehydrogenase n=1 Tax=Sneathiella sp. HT1-7 TaxID=2887192 RepID=UPI001D1338E8|nr:malate/lactate/ureidoglycolate dehydrogenase [Sneathiella sp. HT1-7]MCC3303767.1 malate/lactate/ureidoglycolate dehydrogenase [Sneathiella sp. HT1-7]